MMKRIDGRGVAWTVPMSFWMRADEHVVVGDVFRDVALPVVTDDGETTVNFGPRGGVRVVERGAYYAGQDYGHRSGYHVRVEVEPSA